MKPVKWTPVGWGKNSKWLAIVDGETHGAVCKGQPKLIDSKGGELVLPKCESNELAKAAVHREMARIGWLS